MSARSPVSQRVRFEVFKRDKFTCQYCGRKAPEVVLNCDHLQPVAGGGSSDILNLITSCQVCNGGKGAIPLTDGTAVEKQHEMLAELEMRRQQIEMMVEWREELSSLDARKIEVVARACSRGGFQPSDVGKETIRKWLRRFSLPDILQAVDESFDAYMVAGDSDSWGLCFNRVIRFADINRQTTEKPYIKRVLYIQGILRNRTGHNGTAAFIEHLHVCGGVSLDELERGAKATSHITHFIKPWEDWASRGGFPFLGGRPYR